MTDQVSDVRQQFQNAVSKVIGKFYLECLANDREALEDAAIKRVCACRYYDLADTLSETSDEDLLAIVTKANPCEICGN